MGVSGDAMRIFKSVAARWTASAVIAAGFTASIGASAQETVSSSASAGGDAPRLECIYEQLPTIIKLRFELAARMGGDAAVALVQGARGPAFLELIERCGFTADEPTIDIATRYWGARATRMVSAIEADRAGVNIEALAIALISTTPRDKMPGVAEELMRAGPEAADGPAGEAVLSALAAYETAETQFVDDQRRLAAVFVTAQIMMLGLEQGAQPPTAEDEGATPAE